LCFAAIIRSSPRQSVGRSYHAVANRGTIGASEVAWALGLIAPVCANVNLYESSVGPERWRFPQRESVVLVRYLARIGDRTCFRLAGPLQREGELRRFREEAFLGDHLVPEAEDCGEDVIQFPSRERS